MLQTIKNSARRSLTIVRAVAMFVVMLPVAFVAVMIMTLAGIVALANLRGRYRETGDQGQWMPAEKNTSTGRSSINKPPIEGSYTVLQE